MFLEDYEEKRLIKPPRAISVAPSALALENFSCLEAGESEYPKANVNAELLR